MEKALKKAIEGGWELPVEVNLGERSTCSICKKQLCHCRINRELPGRFLETPELFWQEIICDPLFWQALGKAGGWGKTISAYENNKTVDWQYHWHSFIDHLIAGKDINSFFDNLLTEIK